MLRGPTSARSYVVRVLQKKRPRSVTRTMQLQQRLEQRLIRRATTHAFDTAMSRRVCNHRSGLAKTKVRPRAEVRVLASLQ